MLSHTLRSRSQSRWENGPGGYMLFPSGGSRGWSSEKGIWSEAAASGSSQGDPCFQPSVLATRSRCLSETTFWALAGASAKALRGNGGQVKCSRGAFPVLRLIDTQLPEMAGTPSHRFPPITIFSELSYLCSRVCVCLEDEFVQIDILTDRHRVKLQVKDFPPCGCIW